MASKKYKFLFGLLCLVASGSYAQSTGKGYDVMDSSVIPAKRLPQHNEFMNNSYHFPAKPRSQWEIGVKGGMFTINGDVPAVIPTPGFGVHVRKSLGYVFSIRGEYTWGLGKGLNWKARTAGLSDAYLDNGYSPTGPVFENYRTRVQDLGIQGVFTINNIKFHKNQSRFIAYGFAGIGGTIYKSRVDALDANGNPYNFAGITGNNISNKKETRDALRDLFDGDYETPAENDGDANRRVFGESFRPSFTVGAGVAYRLSQRVNLALENRLTIVKDDLLDGQRWQNSGTIQNGRVLSPENDTYNFFSLGLNVNLGKKATQPLYWANPLDYAYSELNQPRHMKLPKPILDDADGDGVTDQFDKEPNTPAGAPVDAHGVSRDTDGDGVPDYKDKELITPTQCQPVDADGVGKCPEPACCGELRELLKDAKFGCGIGDLPSVSFTNRSVALSKDAQAVLAGAAAKIRNNPNCRIAIVGYGDANKAAQQLSWDRVNAVINYLVEKEGISKDRFIFKYGEVGGDANTVDLRDGSNEDGPNTVPAPHPNLRRK